MISKKLFIKYKYYGQMVLSISLLKVIVSVIHHKAYENVKQLSDRRGTGKALVKKEYIIYFLRRLLRLGFN